MDKIFYIGDRVLYQGKETEILGFQNGKAIINDGEVKTVEVGELEYVKE